MASISHPILGQTVLGRYEVADFIGRGSMGQVWLARDLTQPRYAVVKRIHERIAGQPKYHELFEREMQFMARFKHPHAVEFYDGTLTDPAGPCIVMEYVHGVGLDVILKHRRLLLPEHVGKLLVQLCQALHAAHESGIVHRDLKPANLMVIDPDTPQEFLKVMDLGLAQLAAKPHIPLERLHGSPDLHAAGTPAYICPEQLRGDAVDHRSDFYSLGVILFELLTGRLPFDHADSLKILEAHVKQRPPTFKEVGMGILPPAVERVVLDCLSKYPNERPQSAYELAVQFQRALGHPGDLDPRAFQPASVAPLAGVDAPSARLPNQEQIVERLEAWMPEPIAVVKLRGFVEDAGGKVVESAPGLVRVVLADPPPPPPKKGSLFGLFRKAEPPPGPPPVPPVAIDLHLTRRDVLKQARLEVKAVFRAVDGPLPDDPRWHERCQELVAKLKAYLMA